LYNSLTQNGQTLCSTFAVCPAYTPHGHKSQAPIDDDATGWQRHQRWTGQTAPTPFLRKCGWT